MTVSLHAVYLSRFSEAVRPGSALTDKELLSDVVSNAVEWHSHIVSLGMDEEAFSLMMQAMIAHGVAFSLVEHVISNKGIPRNSYGTDVFVGDSPEIELQTELEKAIYPLLLDLEEGDPLNYGKMGRYSDQETVLRVAARTREWAIREAIVGYKQIRAACRTQEEILTYVITSVLTLHVEGAVVVSDSMAKVLKTLC